MCECIDTMNEAMRPRGAALCVLTLYNRSGRQTRTSVQIQTISIPVDGKKLRGIKVGPIYANFCPFCGENQLPDEVKEPAANANTA